MDIAEKLQLQNIKLNYFGRGSKEIVLGKLVGNKFQITMRNLDKTDYGTLKKNLEILKNKDFMVSNYFDEQRFGSMNSKIGKLILQGKFAEAEEKIGRALKALHKNQLLLYVHSYQSLLFNKILAEYVGSNSNDYFLVKYSHGNFVFSPNRIKNIKLPIIGFGTVLENKFVKQTTEKILSEEKITTRNFVIRQLPKLSSEGDVRDAFVKVEELQVTAAEDDELNEGTKVKISFRLSKGSYATIVLKSLYG